jgi:hypothetical protein
MHQNGRLPMSRLMLLIGSVGVAAAAAVVSVLPVPTTLNDFFLPGSQPGESGQFEGPGKCSNCHANYGDPAEPVFNWRGSMMAQAARDPLFAAAMVIANQDAPESGDLCLRCHTPTGWLEGRSEPTDGSALTPADREGVHCDFCHSMVRPSAVGSNPYPQDADYTSSTYTIDQAYLADIDTVPPAFANGMFVAVSTNAKRGPYVETVARHPFLYSPFHRESAMCGTCHDVSNPVYELQQDGSYEPGTFDAPASSGDPYQQFPVERTYSEWLASSYNSPSGVYAPQFGGNKDYVATCQDCHMRDVTGEGCNKPDAPTRTDLALHDLTGGNTFVPGLIAALYPSEVDVAALDSGVVRATRMLQLAATLSVTAAPVSGGYRVTTTVTNETGHKLPSGYPEGRRIWINVQAYNSDQSLVYESGAYDTSTAVLTQDDDAKIYEIKPGISTSVAPIVNLSSGPSFHFVLNNEVFKDNRIPPRGFTNGTFDAIGSPPVDYAYADGQYWDDTVYDVPAEAEQIRVRLFYQTVSKEYVEFLRDENRTDDAGQILYDAWSTAGKSPPVVMADTTLLLGTLPVELIGFDARSTGSSIFLEWRTASESNNAGFEVEHERPSGTSHRWFVESNQAGSSGATYQSPVENAGPGTHDFRLFQVDLDGRRQLIARTSARVLSPEGFRLGTPFPNPIETAARLPIDIPVGGRLEVYVTDLIGRRLSTIFNGELPAGRHELPLNVRALASGNYVIVASTHSGRRSVAATVAR